jgi:hypothetical protein
MLPRTHLTSRQPPQHAPLETAASIIAHLAASQIFGRLLWQGRFNELILASALMVFMLITIFYLTMPALAEQFTNDLTIATLRASWFLGGAQFAFAAFVLCRPLQQRGLISDVFCLCPIILVGSMWGIWSYWQALTRAATLEEKRRITHDVYQGSAQELGDLARNLEFIDGPPHEKRDERLGRSPGATAEAPHESRQVTGILVAACPGPIDVALEAAGAVAERLQLGMTLDLVPCVRMET